MTADRQPRILYCHCAFAQVIPKDVKTDVLARLSASGREFECVPDLCELSARRDPLLPQLVRETPVRIAACYPRAVQGLFTAAGSPLPTEGVSVINMRVLNGEQAFAALIGEDHHELTNGEAPKP